MDNINSIGNARLILREVGKVIVGKDEIMIKVLLAILAGGHILMEDIPGVGKTTMAVAFSKALGLEYNRVQFTPDVLPSDITGYSIYDKNTGAMNYQKGAILCNLFLADELNRATSRTQSALLQAMEEGEVTVDNSTYPVPEPFIVIATQNPVETQGTFPLPEAQLDRFLIRLSLGYPSHEESLAMMRRFRAAQPMESLSPVATAEDVAQASSQTRACQVSDDVMAYMAALCEAARDPERVRLGPSPRALLALLRISQALAAIRGRDYVIPDDVKELAVPVLAHRVLLRGLNYQQTSGDFIRELLGRVSVPTEEKA